jgi:hypothetical protein
LGLLDEYIPYVTESEIQQWSIEPASSSVIQFELRNSDVHLFPGYRDDRFYES